MGLADGEAEDDGVGVTVPGLGYPQFGQKFLSFTLPQDGQVHCFALTVTLQVRVFVFFDVIQTFALMVAFPVLTPFIVICFSFLLVKAVLLHPR